MSLEFMPPRRKQQRWPGNLEGLKKVQSDRRLPDGSASGLSPGLFPSKDQLGGFQASSVQASSGALQLLAIVKRK